MLYLLLLQVRHLQCMWRGKGVHLHPCSWRLIFNSRKNDHVQDSICSIHSFCLWPGRVWWVCVTWMEGCQLMLGVCWEQGVPRPCCWEQGVPRPRFWEQEVPRPRFWDGGAQAPLAVPPVQGSHRVSPGSAGEGACVEPLTLLSALASSDLCHVNCQDWEGGSRFHRGQWKRSNEFPLCFTAWQTSTYCHFA